MMRLTKYIVLLSLLVWSTGLHARMLLDLDLSDGDQGVHERVVMPGEVVEIELLTPEKGKAIMGFEAEITFDPQQLFFKGFQAGGIMSGAFSMPNIPKDSEEGHSVTVSTALMGSTSMGPGTLGKFIFEAAHSLGPITVVELLRGTFGTPQGPEPIHLDAKVSLHNGDHPGDHHPGGPGDHHPGGPGDHYPGGPDHYPGGPDHHPGGPGDHHPGGPDDHGPSWTFEEAMEQVNRMPPAIQPLGAKTMELEKKLRNLHETGADPATIHQLEMDLQETIIATLEATKGYLNQATPDEAQLIHELLSFFDDDRGTHTPTDPDRLAEMMLDDARMELKDLATEGPDHRPGGPDHYPGGPGDHHPGGPGDHHPGGPGDHYPGGPGDHYPGGPGDHHPGGPHPYGAGSDSAQHPVGDGYYPPGGHDGNTPYGSGHHPGDNWHCAICNLNFGSAEAMDAHAKEAGHIKHGEHPRDHHPGGPDHYPGGPGDHHPGGPGDHHPGGPGDHHPGGPDHYPGGPSGHQPGGPDHYPGGPGDHQPGGPGHYPGGPGDHQPGGPDHYPDGPDHSGRRGHDPNETNGFRNPQDGTTDPDQGFQNPRRRGPQGFRNQPPPDQEVDAEKLIEKLPDELQGFFRETMRVEEESERARREAKLKELQSIRATLKATQLFLSEASQEERETVGRVLEALGDGPRDGRRRGGSEDGDVDGKINMMIQEIGRKIQSLERELE